MRGLAKLVLSITGLGPKLLRYSGLTKVRSASSRHVPKQARAGGKERKHCIILKDQIKITAAAILTCGKTEEQNIFVPVAFNLTLKMSVRIQINLIQPVRSTSA